jgi:hypothetical protein
VVHRRAQLFRYGTQTLMSRGIAETNWKVAHVRTIAK